MELITAVRRITPEKGFRDSLQDSLGCFLTDLPMPLHYAFIDQDIYADSLIRV